ncbi:hypothetical protein COL82_29075 [Bacillus toyonensis]|nr:hypothetical protein COO13_23080 [Bacillus toyonensis]PEB19753.1 hypothetical protein COO08_04795 [Bacillus toyonensis]PEF99347.1 hypothetical protein COO01_08555 [Bacillus toyonensis]PEG16304.1 hypothetical protein COO04_10180 [Bacillus toyonensis]PFZ71042.1 hypothetical protein COL82_29075 [Bacillus toyonensis]
MCIKGFQETFIFFYGHDMAIDFHVSRKDEKQKKNLVNMIKSTVISIFQKNKRDMIWLWIFIFIIVN